MFGNTVLGFIGQWILAIKLLNLYYCKSLISYVGPLALKLTIFQFFHFAKLFDRSLNANRI